MDLLSLIIQSTFVAHFNSTKLKFYLILFDINIKYFLTQEQKWAALLLTSSHGSN